MEEISSVSKIQPILIILSVVIGLAIGQIADMPDGTEILIEVFLIIMLFVVFLSIDLNDVGRSFKNWRFTSTALTLNFIFTPILAVILGLLFLNDSIDMRIGLIMLLVTPCTDWYIVFTAISKGNVSLSTSILPLNFIVQIIALPLSLFLFVGISTSIDLLPLVWSVILVLLIPLLLAIVTKAIMRRARVSSKADTILKRYGDNAQLLFLCLAIVAMFAVKGYLIADDPILLVRMFIPLGVFFVIMFFVSQMIGRRLKFGYADTTSLTFTTLARNSPLDLAIAIVAFPDNPIIALVLVVGPLIELPVLALVSAILLRMRSKAIASGTA